MFLAFYNSNVWAVVLIELSDPEFRRCLSFWNKSNYNEELKETNYGVINYWFNGWANMGQGLLPSQSVEHAMIDIQFASKARAQAPEMKPNLIWMYVY